MCAQAKSNSRSGSKNPRGKKSSALRSEDFQRSIAAIVEAGTPSTSLPAALEKKGIPSPVALVGPQHIRARRIVDWIREQFYTDAQAEYLTYFGSELSSKKSLEPIAQSLMSQSLFASSTLLVIYDTDSIKAPVAKELAAILKQKSESTLILLTAEEASKKTSLLGVLGKDCSQIQLSELSGSTLLRWIQKEAKSQGASGFEPGAAELLVRFFGSDTTQLCREIEKLALLSPPDTAITKKLVTHLSFQNAEVTSFAVVQKIARRDVAGACIQALSLVDQGMHPMQISYFLSRCIRTLLARSSTQAKEQLASEFTNYWFTKNLSGLERSFREQDSSYCLKTLREFDFNLKDSQFDDRMALSLCVTQLASR